jgi:membrane protease YdiL (CAAX protease family)
MAPDGRTVPGSTLVGLALVLIGPPLVATHGAHAPNDTAGSLPAMLVGQRLLVGLLLAILVVVLAWEGRGIDSFRLGRLSVGSLVWGLVLAAAFIVLPGPLLLRLPAWLGLGGFDARLAELGRFPGWYLLLAVVIGGTVEEVLYRGFALDRLTALTSSTWVAGSLTVLAFAAAHVPTWGWGAAVTTAIPAATLTVFCIWRHDLWPAIIAHVLTDFVGIALGPLTARLRPWRS